MIIVEMWLCMMTMIAWLSFTIIRIIATIPPSYTLAGTAAAMAVAAEVAMAAAVVLVAVAARA